MANHPRRKRTFFTVRYQAQIAKFSSNRDAMEFAEHISRRISDLVQVEHKTALVGQYQHGCTTLEFAQHHELRANG